MSQGSMPARSQPNRSTKSSNPGEHPCVEYVSAVCSCGRELATLFYFLTANAKCGVEVDSSFSDFASFVNLDKKAIDAMRFIPVSDFSKVVEENGLLWCCQNSLRFAITSPVSIIRSNEQKQLSRKYPEALPGPMSKNETLSWF
jgi:hypothetical protein